MTNIDQIGHSKYVSLTTYRKDGTGVGTPVWHVMNGGELFIVSDADAWKVKRIRNNSHVVVTVCGIRGKVVPGAPSAEGTARVLDAGGSDTARALLAHKYLLSRLGNWLTRVLHLSKSPTIGIAVSFKQT